MVNSVNEVNEVNNVKGNSATETAATSIYESTPTPAPGDGGKPARKQIYFLTYDHGGYILWGDQFEEKIDSALDWLSKYSKFKIGLDNECFAYDEYARQNPAIIEKIKRALYDYKGRFAIGSSTYGQPLSVFINEESNARQLVYAIRANLEHFGQTPPIYACSEHALHNQIPQLIKQAGYKGAIMRTHFMMYGYNPTYDSPSGMWIGEDGTSIPTVPTYDNEGASFGVTTFDNWVLTRWPDRTTQSPEQYGEKFSHIEPLLASRFDDIVHRHEGLPKHVEGIAEYKWIILEDLLSIYGTPHDEYKPVSNDFRVRMPWGYCGNEIFYACSAAESAIILAERANAAAFLMGAPAAQKTLEEAWKNLLVAQHHDIQICGILGDARKYLPFSQDLSHAVTTESMRYIANKFSTAGAHNLVVFNTHSFDVVERVEIEVAQRGVVGYCVTLNGDEIPCDAIVLDSNRGVPGRAVVVFEACVPANTVQVYNVDTSRLSDAAGINKTAAGNGRHAGTAQPDYLSGAVKPPVNINSAAVSDSLANATVPGGGSAAPLSSNIASAAGAAGVPDGLSAAAAAFERRATELLKARGFAYDAENGFLGGPLYDLTLDKYGIRRLYDRELGLAVIDAPGGGLFRGVIEGVDETSVGAWSVTMGGGGAKAAYTGMIGGIPFLFEMRFYGNHRRIDCRVRFMHNGERVGSVDVPGKVNGFAHEDKLRFVLNTRLSGDIVSARDLPYVIAETDEPAYIQGNYWVARKNAEYGIAIFNSGCRGAVGEGGEFSLPLVYANSYIWGTRMLYGESVHEFALYPFNPKTENYVKIHKAALSYAFPPLTVKTGEHAGEYASSRKIADINGGEGVIMTAMYPEDDAVLLRVCEYGGVAEEYAGPSSLFGITGERVTIMNEPVGSDVSQSGVGNTPTSGVGNMPTPGYSDTHTSSAGNGVTQTSGNGVTPTPGVEETPPIGKNAKIGGIGPWEIITHRIYRKNDRCVK